MRPLSRGSYKCLCPPTTVLAVLQLLSGIATSGCVLLTQVLVQKHLAGASTLVSVHLYSSAAACVLLPVALLLEPAGFLLLVQSQRVALLIAASAALAFSLNFASMRLLAVTSGLTVTIAGQCKDAVLVIFSTFLFSVPVSGLQIVGFTLIIGGTVLYNQLRVESAAAITEERPKAPLLSLVRQSARSPLSLICILPVTLALYAAIAQRSSSDAVILHVKDFTGKTPLSSSDAINVPAKNPAMKMPLSSLDASNVPVKDPTVNAPLRAPLNVACSSASLNSTDMPALIVPTCASVPADATIFDLEFLTQHSGSLRRADDLKTVSVQPPPETRFHLVYDLRTLLGPEPCTFVELRTRESTRSAAGIVKAHSFTTTILDLDGGNTSVPGPD